MGKTIFWAKFIYSDTQMLYNKCRQRYNNLQLYLLHVRNYVEWKIWMIIETGHMLQLINDISLSSIDIFFKINLMQIVNNACYISRSFKISQRAKH